MASLIGVVGTSSVFHGTHSNCIFKFPVFPVRPQISPVPIYVICNYYIHKTYLSSSPKKWKFSRQISKYLLPLESGNLQLEQTKFPEFWQIFQIPCVFPDREFIWPFSLFSLWSRYHNKGPYMHTLFSQSK